MYITVNQASQEPLYLQIRTQIISAIAQGELAPGSKLPAVRRLAADLGINLHTVNKAYAILRDEGYITMKSRAGAVVMEHPNAPASREAADLPALTSERLSTQLNRLILEHKAAGYSAESFMAIAQQELQAAYKQNSKELPHD